MAKNIKMELDAGFSVNVAGRTFDASEIASLPLASVARMLAYGITQYVNDGAALSKKETEGLAPEEITFAKEAGRAERIANILSGTVTTARGPGLRGHDAVRRDVTEEMLRAYLAKLPDRAVAKAASDKTRPVDESGTKGESNWTKACRAYGAKFADKIEEEVTRRMATASEAETVDFDLSI